MVLTGKAPVRNTAGVVLGLLLMVSPGQADGCWVSQQQRHEAGSAVPEQSVEGGGTQWRPRIAGRWLEVAISFAVERARWAEIRGQVLGSPRLDAVWQARDSLTSMEFKPGW